MRNLLDIMELDKMTKAQLAQLCEALYELLGERKAPVVLSYPVLPAMDPLIPNTVPNYPGNVPFYVDIPKITCTNAEGTKV